MDSYEKVSEWTLLLEMHPSHVQTCKESLFARGWIYFNIQISGSKGSLKASKKCSLDWPWIIIQLS